MSNYLHIFGLGTGRCGTLTLARQLGTLRGVLAVHEGVFLNHLKHLRMPHMFHGRVTNPDSIKWNEWAGRVRYTTATRYKTYMEAAGYLSLNIPMLLQVGFRPRIIHLVREPRATIKSFIQKNGVALDVYRVEHPEHKAKWSSWFDAFPPYPGCRSGEEGLARFWNEINLTIECHCALNGLPRLVVHLEQMDRPETWEAIVDFCHFGGKIRAPKAHLNVNQRPDKMPVDDQAVAKAAEKFCTWAIPDHLSRTGE